MAEPLITDIAGVILAGGGSTRFGSNKALAELDGVPLIDHALRTLRGLFTTRLLVTNTPEIYAFLCCSMTGDLYPGSGPLAGIHAALHAIRKERAFVAGCDMPFLDARLIRFLCSQPPSWDAVIPRLAAGPEPLYAVYHKRALPVIEAHLKQGERKISAVLEKLKVRWVSQEEILTVVEDLATFHNINRPGDLTALPRLQSPEAEPTGEKG